MYKYLPLQICFRIEERMTKFSVLCSGLITTWVEPYNNFSWALDQSTLTNTEFRKAQIKLVWLEDVMTCCYQLKLLCIEVVMTRCYQLTELLWLVVISSCHDLSWALDQSTCLISFSTLSFFAPGCDWRPRHLLLISGCFASAFVSSDCESSWGAKVSARDLNFHVYWKYVCMFVYLNVPGLIRRAWNVDNWKAPINVSWADSRVIPQSSSRWVSLSRFIHTSRIE